MSSKKQAPPQAGRASGGWSTCLTALGVSVAIGMMIIGSVTLLDGRSDSWHQAKRSANNLLLALDRDIGRNIAVLDLSLQGLIEALNEPGIADVSPSIRNRTLFDRSATAEDLGSMLVLDTDGVVVADSTSPVPHRLGLGDRDYFKVQQERPDIGLYISRAFQSRLSNGDPRFAISRRLDSPGGEFAGIVLATLRLNYLSRLFEKLDVGVNGTITLLRTDGRVLYRYPFRPKDLDADFSRAANFPRFSASRSGQYVGKSGIDGIERLFTFRRVGDYPLILTISLSTEEIFRAWHRKAIVIGLTMVLMCTLAIASVLLFRREVRRRTESERALAAAADQLAVLASTDGLTGLMNRRAFDSEYDRAFRAAVRSGRAVAVMMIDVDYFKRFNDTYGHVAGDDVLRMLAGCLKANLRRPCDRLARYGGEEFVAVLPDTEEGAAIQIAGRLLAAVKGLQRPHDSSPIGWVSVSIGVSAASPLLGDRPEDLLQRADAGLYEAKEAGRDGVRSVGHPARPGTDLAVLAYAATGASSQHDPA